MKRDLPLDLVVELRDAASLRALVPQWEELAAHALEPNPFYEHWMLLPALEAFAAERELRFVCVWRGGRLGAFFPLERVRRYKGLPFAALRSWCHAHCLLGAPLVRADCAAESLAAFWRWLPERAALLELKYIPADGALGALLRQGPRCRVTARYERGLLRRQADPEAGLSAQLRRQLRKLERRLAARGALAYVALAPGEDAARWIEELLALEAAGWKGRKGSALASSAPGLRFARAALGAAASRGRLLVSGLDFDGRPIARRASVLAGEGAFAFKTAYCEAFAPYSPGVLAERDNLRRFAALAGVQWMDSYTDAGNQVINRMWRERRAVETLLAGAGARARLLLPALAALRRLRNIAFGRPR